MQTFALRVGEIPQQDLDDPVPCGLLAQCPGQQVRCVQHFDAEQLQYATESGVLLASPIAVEDVVEEQLLHHRRDHAIDLGTWLVDQGAAQTADLGGDADHRGREGRRALTASGLRPADRRGPAACVEPPRTGVWRGRRIP